VCREDKELRKMGVEIQSTASLALDNYDTLD
jgi:hypothetical protein